MSTDDDKYNETEKSISKQRDHERKSHRLQTARYTILVGMFGIVVFVFLGFMCSGEVEIIDNAISVFAAIVTLSLGFIAGSTIE